MAESILVQAYYYSQIALAVIAGVAAFGAYYQIQTFQRFELLKLLESPHVKLARQSLYLAKKRLPEKKWWNVDDPAFDQDLEQAAAIVAGSFDLVGIIAKGSNRRFFQSHWGHSIRWTHEALAGFLEERRSQAGGNPRAYAGYEKLHKEVR